MVVGLPGGLTRVFASLPDSESTGDLVSQVQELARQRCPHRLELSTSSGCGVFTVQRRLADTFQHGRVLLAGDAAHVHSPAGGQGLNTGIQDGHELGWRLADIVAGRRPVDDVVDWAQERRHVAAQVISDTDRQTRLWLLSGWRSQLRDAALAIGERVGALDRLQRRLAQLDLRYPAGRGRLGLLREGCRVPDLRAGENSRMHELLLDRRQLLAVVSTGSAQAAVPAWLSEQLDLLGELAPTLRLIDGRVGRRLRVTRPGLALIRPDGVVAVAGSLTDPDLAHRVRQRLPFLPSLTHPVTTPARSH